MLPQNPSAQPPASPAQQGGEVEGKILSVLQQAKMLAEENGVDFGALVKTVMGVGGGSSAPKAPAPMPPSAVQ